MKIETSKFTIEEVKKIIKECRFFMGNKKSLKMFNEANYFQIKKFYYENILVGYGVIFLGYNGLESNDISIEDIAYWGNLEGLSPLIDLFIEQIINSKNIPFPVENVYYNENIPTEEKEIFSMAGFKSQGKAR